MLRDVEETLTDTVKAAIIGASTDPNTASLPVKEHKNDQQLGESMDENSTAFTIAPETAEKDGGPQQATRPQRDCSRSSVAPHK
ncbi:hypothetical protein MTO96_006571 [Rhipicephalus appendiculatus]